LQQQLNNLNKENNAPQSSNPNNPINKNGSKSNTDANKNPNDDNKSDNIIDKDASD